MSTGQIGYDVKTSTGDLNAQKEKTARTIRQTEGGRRTASSERPTTKAADSVRSYRLGGGIRGSGDSQSEGAPMKIVAVYDNGGRSLDRYTILTDQSHNASLIMALGVGDNPDDFSQWTGAQIGDHLGKKISFESLSGAVQAHVAKRIFEAN